MKTRKLLADAFGERRIEELPLRFFCLSCDLVDARGRAPPNGPDCRRCVPEPRDSRRVSAGGDRGRAAAGRRRRARQPAGSDDGTQGRGAGDRGRRDRPCRAVQAPSATCRRSAQRPGASCADRQRDRDPAAGGDDRAHGDGRQRRHRRIGASACRAGDQPERRSGRADGVERAAARLRAGPRGGPRGARRGLRSGWDRRPCGLSAIGRGQGRGRRADSGHRARRRIARNGDRVHRRDDRQHRIPGHRALVPRHVDLDPVVGTERLQHRVRGVPGRGRSDRRPARAPADVHLRRRAVLGRVAAVRVGAVAGRADRLPSGAGARRRVARAGVAGARAERVPAGASRARRRAVVGGRRGRRRARPLARRRARLDRRLATRVPRQHSRSASWRSCSRGAR